jgi:hypothetical protein
VLGHAGAERRGIRIAEARLAAGAGPWQRRRRDRERSGTRLIEQSIQIGANHVWIGIVPIPCQTGGSARVPAQDRPRPQSRAVTGEQAVHR